MILRNIIIRLCDCIIWGLSFFISLWLTKHIVYSPSSMIVGLMFLTVHIIVFEIAKMYRNIWRYLNSSLLLKGIICQAIACGLLIGILECFGVSAKRVVVIALCSELVLWNMSRIVYVVLYQISERKKKQNGHMQKHKKMLLIGAGEAAEILLHEISGNPDCGYIPICAVDDSADKIGRYIHGVKIVGTTNDIMELCKIHEIEVVIFAIYNIAPDKKQKILNECADAKIAVKLLPHYADFVNNSGNNINKIRDVSIDDLLCRERTKIDIEQIDEFISGKKVMVTGGGGSIGSELCRQIATHNPDKIIIVDICENGAYDIQQDLKEIGFKNIVVCIASVTDFPQMKYIFSKYTPDIVYHAAAHKHVPLMENCKIEAVKNNIFGTKNIVELADEFYECSILPFTRKILYL